MKKRNWKNVIILISTALLATTASPDLHSGNHNTATVVEPGGDPAGEVAKKSTDSVTRAVPADERLTRKGLTIDFIARPTPGRSMSEGEISAGDYVDLSFRIVDASTEDPIRAQFPGVWLDLFSTWDGEKREDRDCRERVGLYLQGLIGIRPMIDLNSYFILALNRDPSISVIDPVIGITGITKLYAQVNLESPGADWTKSSDQNRLFVTMPDSNMVAVVDAAKFKVGKNIPAGEKPVRVLFQPDEKYLWVGNDAEGEKDSGITAIDVDKGQVAMSIPTGPGHHEIAFSSDSRYAFATNRFGKTVSVIDTGTLTKVKDIEIGPTPISLAYSNLSKALYVADAEKGEITVISGVNLEIITRIQVKQGLGPMGFSQDGRWGVVVNTQENLAYVIDPSTNRIAHTITVNAKPYQVAFSRSFAYVRSLGSERVSMFELAKLGTTDKPPVVTFAAGEKAPETANDISIASGIVEAPGEAAVMVVSPGDEGIFYYMEGMNAPMGNFRNYGHRPRAVQVVDRSMQEKEPGVYSATVRIPEAGTYDVAFLLESPEILHCFSLAAKPNPRLTRKGPALAVEYLMESRSVEPNSTATIRFRLTDPETGSAQTDLTTVHVLYYIASGHFRTEVPAQHVGNGVYEAKLKIRREGAYFVWVGCLSKNVKYTDLPYTTILAQTRKFGK